MWRLALALGFAQIAFASPAAAQNWNGGAPPGSYRQTCTNLQVNGVVLSADCRDTRGVRRNSSIAVDRCRGDIANDNGRLVCRAGDSSWQNEWSNNRVPPGSYRQSCRNAELRRNALTAQCRDNANRWRQAIIDPRACQGQDIANENGRLVCGRGGGIGRGRLTGFDSVRFGGERRTFSSYEENLGEGSRRFNDRIESIEIDRGQRWEICSDANFRGRCVTIDRSYRDLRAIGMANTVSSLRRVN